MKIKTLFICHLCIAFLLGTFLWPVTKVYWDLLDLFFFRLLNDPLENNKLLQYFWAFSNHKAADWIEDIVFFIFFYLYVSTPSEKNKLRKVAELSFCVLLIAFIIFFINKTFFREQVRILRDSPTLLIDQCVRLSYEIPWLSIKDTSPKCFPADHATTALLFAFTYSFLMRHRLSILACLYSIYLCLPRMATGAHWLSDVLVGSGTIALFFLSWAYCTPVHQNIVDYLERFLRLFQLNENSLTNKSSAVKKK